MYIINHFQHAHTHTHTHTPPSLLSITCLAIDIDHHFSFRYVSIVYHTWFSCMAGFASKVIRLGNPVCSMLKMILVSLQESININTQTNTYIYTHKHPHMHAHHLFGVTIPFNITRIVPGAQCVRCNVGMLE